MNGEKIDYVDFYDDLGEYFNEFVPSMNKDEEYEYDWDDLHSVWVYMYKNEIGDVPCYQEVKINATFLFMKFQEFLEKHGYNDYMRVLGIMVLFEQKVAEFLDELYNKESND